MTLFRCAALAAALALPFTAAAADRLTLTDAFQRAIAADPSLPAAGARVDAAVAGERQSGASPNPSLGLEVENFAGSGALTGFDEAETTLSYEQQIELGGKRDARMGLARREREAAEARVTVARLNLLEQVQIAYGEALAADAEVRLAEGRLEVARFLAREVARRIASARDPEFAGERAKSQVASAELALEQAKLNASAALQRLGSYWAGGGSYRLDMRIFEATDVPAAAGEAAASADLTVLEAERAASAARVSVERSKSVADPTLSLGVRHFGRNDDVAVVVGGSIPLTIFDDNRGNVDRAAAEQRAADLDLASYRVGRDREILRLRSELAIAAAEVRQIDAKIIPAAERAAKLVLDGFSRGAFTYLDVTEAQRALNDERARRIAVLRAFHANKAALDRLLGTYSNIASAE